jgi:hypothetical protein
LLRSRIDSTTIRETQERPRSTPATVIIVVATVVSNPRALSAPAPKTCGHCSSTLGESHSSASTRIAARTTALSTRSVGRKQKLERTSSQNWRMVLTITLPPGKNTGQRINLRVQNSHAHNNDQLGLTERVTRFTKTSMKCRAFFLGAQAFEQRCIPGGFDY